MMHAPTSSGLWVVVIPFPGRTGVRQENKCRTNSPARDKLQAAFLSSSSATALSFITRDFVATRMVDKFGSNAFGSGRKEDVLRPTTTGQG